MSNLPPGVTDSMIPGNRPEDALYEKVYDDLADLLDESYSVREQNVRPSGLDRFADDMDELVTLFVQIVNRYGPPDEDARFDR